jgi:hypothetical protein
MFRRAVKRDAKLRLALSGPAGSGKTYSLLAIATGLGGGIAYVDTERGSASKYADLFAFDVVEPAEFDPRQLIHVLAAMRTKTECGKDPIRIGHVRRTVWELGNAPQEAKENAAQEEKGKAARREGERSPGEGSHGD